MAKNLVIVESPAKAKTIEKFLGKDFQVKSCFGHIRDLAKGDKAVDTANGFEPTYVVPSDKKELVKELKKLAKASEMVWLASDEDREGEAISWHLSEVLGLTPEKRKRIVFHEITKTAILNAIDNPRDIDEHLVDAQQARRILDRLVGFKLSPVLWKKVRPSLSAGRVQSVAVRLIVEREREIERFDVENSYRVTGIFKVDGKSFEAELNKRFDNLELAEAFLNEINPADFSISNVEVKPASKKPAPPFTTSTLQQEASRKLGYSVTKTMMLAQRLYENGHITYMRTDSLNLSGFALASSKETIEKNWGAQYSKMRKYSTKSAGAQEAHEAIRPTSFDVKKAGDDPSQIKLYDLIWKRSIASQMADAQLEKTIVKINNDKNEYIFTANGEVLKFDGFLKVYIVSQEEDEEEEQSGLLPEMKVGDHPKAVEVSATERFSRPPARYSEAGLVKRLEELGIGRPSTYAPTISTVQKRGYVDKGVNEGEERAFQQLTLKNGSISKEEKTEKTGSDKNKLVPTDIGKVVTDFLTEHFGQIMDYTFTASVEKEFDDIANGLIQWTKMIDSFYNPFNATVDKTLDEADRVSGERLLGVDPATGLQVYVRVGRYGPMAQIGESNTEDKPRFASLQKSQSIEQISLEEALKLFELPRVLGKFEETDIKAAIGRFGPYVLHKSKFVSIPKGEDPHDIELDRAIELILAKRKQDAERLIQTFEEEPELQILNGRWGPFISYKKNNYRIAKDQDPKALTLADCMKIVKEQGTGKGKAKAKTTPKAKAKAKPKTKSKTTK
jgi:DNA topoisomerase-1